MIRLGVIGCGELATRVHLPHLVGLAEVVALCDTSPQSLTRAAALRPDARLFTHHTDLLEETRLDACLVCTPTPHHFEPALDVIRRGIPLYLEKPVCETTAEARRLEAAQRVSQSPVAIGCNFRLHPLFQELAQQDLSTACAVRSTFTTAGGSRPGWVFHSGNGRGTLLELATHELDLFCSLFGWDIRTVWARLQGGSVALQMETAGGLGFQGLFSMQSCEEARFEVFAGEGKFTVDRYRNWALEISPARNGGFASRLAEDLRQLAHFSYGLRKSRAPANEISYRNAWVDFQETLRGGKGGLPNLEEGLKIMELIDAAESSILSGSPVSL